MKLKNLAKNILESERKMQKQFDSQIQRLLERRRNEFIEKIENQIGNRNSNFQLGEIHYATWGPMAYAKDNIVNIALCENVMKNGHLENWKLAKWQLAHECVHLLDPVNNNNNNQANVLEEGLATWFQNKQVLGMLLRSVKYIEAEKLFKKYSSKLIPKIHYLRKQGVSLKCIKKQQLLEEPNKIDSQKAAETGLSP